MNKKITQLKQNDASYFNTFFCQLLNPLIAKGNNIYVVFRIKGKLKNKEKFTILQKR